MAAGDTCVVYAGTYPEDVTLTAGTAGGYKTLVANSGDMVYVLSFTIDSYNKIIGFHIQNPNNPTAKRCINIGNAATNVYITNNSMYACAGMLRSISSLGMPSYIFVQGNTMSYPCTTSNASTSNACAASREMM